MQQNQDFVSESGNLDATAQNKQDNHHFMQFQTSIIVRDIAIINSGQLILVLTHLDVRAFQYNPNMGFYLIKIIRRLAIPKTISVPQNKNIVAIHFSDNYCIVYETFNFQQIQTLVGISLQHQGLRFSHNGFFILYVSNQNFQIWNILSSKIELMTDSVRSGNCYCLNSDSTEAYIGTYQGNIIMLSSFHYQEKKGEQDQGKGFEGRVIEEIRYFEVFKKTIMGIQVYSDSLLVCISMDAQVAVLSCQKQDKSGKRHLEIVWKKTIGNQPMMTLKLVKIICLSGFIFFNLTNEIYWFQVDAQWTQEKKISKLPLKIKQGSTVSLSKGSEQSLFVSSWIRNSLNLQQISIKNL